MPKTAMGKPKLDRAAFVFKRAETIDEATTLVLALHEKGFSSVWIQSTSIGDDSHYHARIIIDDPDMSHDRMSHVMKVAEDYGAKVFLCEVRMNQQVFSRIALWPMRGA